MHQINSASGEKKEKKPAKPAHTLQDSVSTLDLLVVPLARAAIKARTKTPKGFTAEDFSSKATRMALRYEVAEDRRNAEERKRNREEAEEFDRSKQGEVKRKLMQQVRKSLDGVVSGSVPRMPKKHK